MLSRMAFTSADLESHEAAIASGIRRATIAGREIEYRSIDELIKARNLIRKELYLAARPSNAPCIPTCTATFDDA